MVESGQNLSYEKQCVTQAGEEVTGLADGVLVVPSILQLWLILPLSVIAISVSLRSMNLRPGVNVEAGGVKTEV